MKNRIYSLMLTAFILFGLAACKSEAPALTPDITDTDTPVSLSSASQSSIPASNAPIGSDNDALTETPEESGDESEEASILQAIYLMYYELIESLIDDYGVGYNQVSNGYEGDLDFWWRSVYRGIVYAELIDFDYDGIPELIVIFNNGVGLGADLWNIYGYNRNIELYYSTYSGGDGGSYSEIEIALSSDGARYLVCVDNYEVYDNELYYSYYTVEDGAWYTALTRSFSITDESRHGSNREGFQWQWLVNGYEVGENEYETAAETELGIISIQSIPIPAHYLQDFETANEKASDVVYSLLADLESRISQL